MRVPHYTGEAKLTPKKYISIFQVSYTDGIAQAPSKASHIPKKPDEHVRVVTSVFVWFY
jgi:hypothetical protein